MLGLRRVDAVEAHADWHDAPLLPRARRRPRAVCLVPEDDPASRRARGRDIFACLSRSGGGRRHRNLAIPVSLGIHAAALALLVLLSILWPSPLPTQRDYTGAIMPVQDYDQPPRLPKQVRPRCPQEAFVKKIEGTVVLELLIDAAGRVARARLVQSAPALGAAALKAAREWVFSPAIKQGRPEATVATGPVTFRIY